MVKIRELYVNQGRSYRDFNFRKSSCPTPKLTWLKAAFFIKIEIAIALALIHIQLSNFYHWLGNLISFLMMYLNQLLSTVCNSFIGFQFLYNKLNFVFSVTGICFKEEFLSFLQPNLCLQCVVYSYK
jgi:ABC-type polysaccharide/polyol phosphate export permease